VSIKAVLNLDPALSAHLLSASRLAEKRPRCATGIGALDDLLGGGWPVGALSELCGRRSSGRTAVLYAALASAIAAGHTVALVDSGGALDPRRAAEAGIALDRLLWIRCAAAQALKAADLLLTAGGFGLLALDLGEGRVNGSAWNRLKHAAERQQTAVLVATPWRTVGAFAAAAISLRARHVRFHRRHAGGDASGATSAACPPLLADLETVVERERGGAALDRAAAEVEGNGACASLVFSSPS
jgi:recA bacterial DNA recombination protein